jgi:tetratricopeptide (TPR) repeat protein/tRNA A-37 threonylcarbamoyl transferase component Bud32
MPEPGNTIPDPSLDLWEHCERILERFEAAWQRGERPDIDSHLPPTDAGRPLVLLELVHADLECRLKVGEPARVEDYLGRFPELGTSPETVLALLAAEYGLRCRREPDLVLAEYVGRFPALAADLERRLYANGARPGSSFSEGGQSTVTETSVPKVPPAAAAGDAPPGRYRCLRVHARGGLGEVLVAHDEELQREVALKRLQAAWADSRDSRRRFLREARITARLQHPGIVPVYGLVTDEHGRPCYAMRLIEGDSLKDAIARFHRADVPGRDPTERSLALRELLMRFVAVCNTLAYAHSRGVLHRDIKPSNILLGKYGETLVVDWGLAKPFKPVGGLPGEDDDTLLPAPAVEAEGATQVGLALGTPAYMGPEQAAGRWDLVGPASDVYSLGASLYQLLTGRVPFPTRNVEETLAKAQKGEFPPPRQVKPAVAAALEAVCLKAMARLPQDRYATALDLAGDVERWLADEPVPVWREPLPSRLARWARRHRTAVVAAAVALVFLAAAGVAVFLLRGAAEERRHEYLTRLRSNAEAGGQLALEELHADRFRTAAQVLNGAVHNLESEPVLAAVREDLTARRDRAERLAEFYELANRAERLEAEQSTRRDNFADSGAPEVCERGLSRLGVFDHAEWWKDLPDQDLTAEQAERLREDVYHQLLLLAAVRAKRWTAKPGSPEMDGTLRAGLEAVRAANRYRPGSFSGSRMEAFGLLLLRQPARKGGPDLAREPTSATDYYFSGLLHLGVFIATDPSENRPMLDQIMIRLAGQVAPLDFKTPLQTAERHLRMAVALEPSHYWSHCWLGLTLAKAGKWDAAELAWDGCVALQPGYPTAYWLRAGALLHRLQRTADPLALKALLQQALADCDAAVRLDPLSAAAYRERAYCHAHGKHYAAAIADCDEAVRLDPRSAEALLTRGFCHQHLQEYEQALADFDGALKVAPNEPEAYQGRSQAYLLQGEFERAIVELNRAIGLQEKNPFYHADRGLAHLHLGQWEQALADFTRASELRPGDAAAAWHVALLRLRQGDRNGYRKACSGLLERFDTTKDAVTANLVARACVLGPGAADPARIIALAARPGDNAVTRGAALYRADRFEEAVRVLTNAHPAGGSADETLSLLFRALAEMRLGHGSAAARLLRQALLRVDEPRPIAADPFEKLQLDLLAAEARNALRPSKP